MWTGMCTVRYAFITRHATAHGTPHVDGAKVTLAVLSHDLAEKRSTFKYTARQRTRVGRGFRASTTKVRVESISA